MSYHLENNSAIVLQKIHTVSNSFLLPFGRSIFVLRLTTATNALNGKGIILMQHLSTRVKRLRGQVKTSCDMLKPSSSLM